MSNKISVLYLDDEISNINSFKANFRRDYDIYTALNANDALEHLKARDIHVIIADQRMPEITGVDFYESIIDDFPNPVRIILTGYSDIEAVMGAINRGKVFRYIDKPWDADVIDDAIKKAYETYLYKVRKDRETDLFVYKVSHDLRGPLASMRGLVELMKYELNSGNDVLSYVELLERSIDRLHIIFDELIEFKRIENEEPELGVVVFSKLVEEVLADLTFVEHFDEINIVKEISEFADFQSFPFILRSVFQNLIHNSIKYGRYDDNAAFIRISAQTTATESVIEIQDNGIGMDEIVLSKVFEKYYRGTEISKGIGLGMYIVKMGADRLKGTLSIDSKPNVGTTIRLTIPNLKN